MEFLPIGDDQLKITLSEDELLFYGLELSSLSYSSTQTRRGFWALLDDAKQATGFDAAATKVSVQIYASRQGGCEMYILAEPADRESVNTDPDTLPVESGLTVCPAIPRTFSPAIGRFNSLGDLLSACLALQNNGYPGESSAWKVGNRYYLCLTGTVPVEKKRKSASGMDATGVLWEFAAPAKEITPPYLTEYGIPLCPDNAVEKLSRVSTGSN